MSDINLSFVDGIQNGRSLTLLAKEIRNGIDEYINTMPLPEGTDLCQRENIRLWVNKYMDGECSFESLNNILAYNGFDKLLKSPIHEVEVDESGKLTLYKLAH